MIKSVLYEAFLSMTGNKMRSFLTTLGIIIGVCAVVMMVAAGQAVQNMNLMFGLDECEGLRLKAGCF